MGHPVGRQTGNGYSKCNMTIIKKILKNRISLKCCELASVASERFCHVHNLEESLRGEQSRASFSFLKDEKFQATLKDLIVFSIYCGYFLSLANYILLQ